MTATEAQTRQQRIDADLARAGWAGRRRNLQEEVLLRVAERRGEDRSELVYVLAWTQGTEPVWP